MNETEARNQVKISDVGKRPIAILGAGIAGLTAANFLKRNNVPFVLFEASNKIIKESGNHAGQDFF